jgi:Mg-chelatase subunit ChlD
MKDLIPFDTVGDESVEARIVAWVLGEASAFEATELERLCEERPELLVFRRRMRTLHGLLTAAEATEADGSWKLPAEKRKVLDEILDEDRFTGSDPQKDRSIHFSARRAFLTVAACLLLAAIIVGLSAPMVIRQRKSADGVVRHVDYMPSSEGGRNSKIALQASAPSTPPSDSSYRLESKSISSNRELGMLKTKEQSMLANSPAKPASSVADSATPEQTQLPLPAESRVIDPLPAIAASGLGGGEGMGSGMALGDDAPAIKSQSGSLSHEAPMAEQAHLALDDPGRARWLSQAHSPSELSASFASSMPVDASQNETDRVFQSPTELEVSLFAGETEPLSDLANEIPAAETPYSTFSLNISDASFQLAKAALARGERPIPASIKPEQFYNAVDYGDPAPASDELVAATIEQSAHPVIPGRNLVRVALRTGSVGRSAAQPLRLTLLVDQSGSMVREDRRASMEHALDQLGVLLTKNDLVTVIGFSRTPHLLAEGKSADETLKLPELINQTASEGGTNLEEALKLGGQLAERYQLAGAQNRIVLFTDGAANLGDANPARLAEQVKAFRQKGLAFDVAGIGADGLNDRLLSELARNGNGRYYVVGDDKNDSLARQLAGAFRPSAQNVKVQVNFNPKRVGNYKLIGFEKDRLKTEDFRNDAMDAAELAADEAGVAIYQVEPLADGTGEIGEVSVRFRDAATQEMVERTWTIPHESQATAFDRATPSMQLAGLALLAAEKLKGGTLAEAIDFKQLTGSSALVKQFYAGSSRVSDMLRVIDALK